VGNSSPRSSFESIAAERPVRTSLPAIVIGDENPLRETEHWRVRAAQHLKVPLWTVDADVVVPSRLTG
jgi:hypothetical protein